MDTKTPLAGTLTQEGGSWHGALAQVGLVLSTSDCLNCLLLAAIPIAISLVNSSWLYTPIGYIDPWVNNGFFLHYADPAFENWYYKIARLSWIIPGFVAYHIFRPIVANYILHMGCLLASVAFFYLTVARLFGPIIAFATAACFAVFIPFHGSGGWDYQNAPAGAYYILAFYLLTSAVFAKDMRLWLIGAGAAYASAIHATISFINMAPIMGAHFFILYRERYARFPAWHVILRTGLWYLVGAVVLTVLLGLVNVAVGRDFLFFKLLLNIVISRVQDSQGQEQWWLPWSTEWFLQGNYFYYMMVIVVCLVTCAASVALAVIRSRFNSVALSLQLQYVFIAVLWIVWQNVGQTALQPDYFAYPIFPVMFFGIAGAAANWQSATNQKVNSVLFSEIIGAIAFISLSFPVVDVVLLDEGRRLVYFILAGAALVSLGLFSISGGRLVIVGAAAFLFIVMNELAAAVAPASPVGRPTPALDLYRFREPCRDRAGEFAALINSHLFLSKFVTNPEEMFVWWNKSELLTTDLGCAMGVNYFAGSLASTGFQYLAPPWSGMPDANELPPESISVISGVRRLAVLTNDESDVDRVIKRYQESGVRLVTDGETNIRTSLFSFSLYVLRAETIPADAVEVHGAFGPPLIPGSNWKLQETFPANVSTPARPWGYGAQFPLRTHGLTGPVWIRVRADVSGGPIGIGVLDQDGRDFLSRTSLAASNDATVTLAVMKAEEIGDLVI